LKGYVTNPEAPTAEYVMGAYHQLWQIEKSFRISKSDLRARPIYHHKRDSIEAHLTIVFAALAADPLPDDMSRMPQASRWTRRSAATRTFAQARADLRAHPLRRPGRLQRSIEDGCHPSPLRLALLESLTQRLLLTPGQSAFIQF
jgi:hypothetical protein